MTPDQLLKEINKALGTDALAMASDPKFATRVIRTGILPIDVALGGGVPRNRVTELYGGFSTLKSLIGVCAIAQVQKAGGTAALVDTEATFDHEWAAQWGVDTTKLLMPACHTGEEAMDTTSILVENGIDILVWDSVAATMPQDEAKKRMGKENIQPGRQAAFMSQALRRITALNSNTALIFTNQTREKVGVTFGNPQTTPGGHALPFYASHRVMLRKGQRSTEPFKVWDGQSWVDTKKTTAYRVHATLEKSKLTSPGREYVFTWDSTLSAIDDIGYMISFALEAGWVKTSGQSWSYGTTKKSGKEAFKTWIRENKAEELRARIYDSLDGVSTPAKSKGARLRRKQPVNQA